MIKTTGTMRDNNVTRVLTIHSKNLAEAITNINREVTLENYNEGVILKPHGNSHATIVKNKRIQIAIKTLVKKGLLNQRLMKEKNIFVYIDKNEWGIEEFWEKSRGDPMTNVCPDNLVVKRAGIRTNTRGRYFLDISSKKLYELAKNNTIRCLINKKEDITIIKSNDPAARKLTPHGIRRIQISIPQEALTKEELSKLNINSWLPINLKLNLKSFGLSMTDFYSVKEEKELADFLIKKGMEIKVKDYRDPYDLLLPEKKVAIEVHNSSPSEYDFSTRHKIKPAMIRLRILEAEFFLNKLNLERFIVIINEKWAGGKYIKELTDCIDKKINVIYTDFKEGWCKKIENNLIG